MKLKQIIDFLEQIAPPSFQEDYDNSGIQIGDINADISKVLLCLDVTPAVLTEAADKGCSLVISHHPLLFKGIRRITPSDAAGEMILFAIQNGITVYSLHTNLDNVESGVNKALADRLGLQNIRILEPMMNVLSKITTFCPNTHVEKVRQALFEAGCGKIGNYDSCSFNVEGTGTFRALPGATPYVGKEEELHFESETRIECVFPSYLTEKVVSTLRSVHPYEEVAFDLYQLKNADHYHGAGMIGKLTEPLTPSEFLAYLKKTLGLQSIRHNDVKLHKIEKVALCGGSGSFLIKAAMKAAADAFVTADIKYHQFQEPGFSMLLCDVGHYESECYILPHLANFLAEKFPNFAILISEAGTNPVRIFN